MCRVYRGRGHSTAPDLLVEGGREQWPAPAATERHPLGAAFDPPDLLAQAWSLAAAQAQRELGPILKRRSERKAAAWLRRRADDLAHWPLLHRQLLALAFEAMAGLAPASSHDRRGGAPVDRRTVLDLARRRTFTVDLGVAVDIEAERLGRLGPPPFVRAWLLRYAALHARLWDHPGLPADLEIRSAMIAIIPRLHARAQAAAPCAPAQPRRSARVH